MTAEKMKGKKKHGEGIHQAARLCPLLLCTSIDASLRAPLLTATNEALHQMVDTETLFFFFFFDKFVGVV